MDSENNLQACLSFFRERPVFDEILVQLREKYRSYGRCAGSAQICVESEEALADLEGFMRKKLSWQKEGANYCASICCGAAGKQILGIRAGRIIGELF